MGCAPLGEVVAAPTIRHAENNAERIAPELLPSPRRSFWIAVQNLARLACHRQTSRKLCKSESKRFQNAVCIKYKWSYSADPNYERRTGGYCQRPALALINLTNLRPVGSLFVSAFCISTRHPACLGRRDASNRPAQRWTTAHCSQHRPACIPVWRPAQRSTQRQGRRQEPEHGEVFSIEMRPAGPAVML
jgi:hypothetical protein